jgi:N-acyl-D-amino-acid deacylase
VPQAIAKMTGGAAAALVPVDRGLLREGQAADVVLFDPATITDRSTYERPALVSGGHRDSDRQRHGGDRRRRAALA